jgi:hypothetical protein
MKNRLLLCLPALGVAAFIACGDPAEPVQVDNTIEFTATLTVADEVPKPTVGNPTGSGTFSATLDTVTKAFTYDLTFTGLSSGVNNGHIHGPADAGVATGALLNFNTLTNAQFSFGATTGTGHGVVLLIPETAITATVNGDSLRKLLLAGKTYANIHTTNNAQGEIRGMIIRKP